MSIQVTLIGLEQIGASIGLALAQGAKGTKQQETLYRVGNDIRMDVAQQAQKMGAIDKITYNLPRAVEKADIVILAVPIDQIHETMKIIAPDLKEGAVLIDTSPLKIKVAEWAQELLKPERFFVSVTPTLNPIYLHETALGVKTAHADLFKNSSCIITAPHGTHEDAMKLAADFAALMGSTPFFTDPFESDGLIAATWLLPEMIAAALLDSTVDRPGWREARRVASRAYALATAPILHMTEEKPLGQIALINHENVTRVIDSFVVSLQKLRGLLETGDEAALHKYMLEARDGRFGWFVGRERGTWDETPKLDIPTVGDRVGQMFFGKLFTRRDTPKRK